MKILVIAEKPDMGRNIASAIEPKAVNKRTYLEGEQYVITWAIGHLISLAEPDRYDEKYKKWRFEHLPILPDKFKLIANYKTKDQLQVIADLAKRCGAIVNACDAGREGQRIFSLIQQYLQLKQPVKRLWISDLTKETIRKGFNELKDSVEYVHLTQAAKARSEADWIIGMNGSRAFTIKHNALLSVGRVQTPVLALLYDRHREIASFQKVQFYEVIGHFEQNGMNYKGTWQGDELKDRTPAEEIAVRVQGKQGMIEKYEVKESKEYPYKLYDLTLLQREANAKFGFSAKKTLDLAQALYEKHKVISYPRTNSNYVTEQNVPEMHRMLDQFKGTAYETYLQGADRSIVHKNNKSVCNPAKVEDHHAILPTMKKAYGLSADELKIYDLIVRRFFSQFYPPARYKNHSLITMVGQDSFKTTVKEMLDAGWKAIYADLNSGKEKAQGKGKSGGGEEKEEGKEKESGHEEEEISTPFFVDVDQPVNCVRAESKEKETQPPKPYTEGTLLKAMETAGKQIENEELREAMKDSGLGTPATRAAIIERLKHVGYVEMRGKKIEITTKGRTAVELIRGAGVSVLASPEMTGVWERRLNEISKGQASSQDFMDKVKKFAISLVDKVRVQQANTSLARAERKEPVGKKAGENRTKSAKSANSDASAKAGPTFITACPRAGCGGNIFMGKKGYGCSHYKQGCSFVIWKNSFGKNLTDRTIKTLIEKGKTGLLKFTEQDGHAYEARIVLENNETGQLKLELKE